MTRGKIIFIQNDLQVYFTCEFNGDMHPDMHGEDILDSFQNGVFETYQGYKAFVEKFNRKFFCYEDELIKDAIRYSDQIIDITNNWTDYLYIINESSSEWNIVTKEKRITLPSRSLGIAHYQKIIDTLVRDNRGYLKKSDVLSQEEFVNIINRLREASDLQEQVNRIFRNSRENLENDFGNAAALQISHESTVVFLLKKVLCDKYDYIEYFIYELDYGRKYESGMITDENGQAIDIYTPELLYDFILDSGITCQEEV